MADTIEQAAARAIWRTNRALSIPSKRRAGCAKVREGRRQALQLVATDIGVTLAEIIPGFDREAYQREVDRIHL